MRLTKNKDYTLFLVCCFLMLLPFISGCSDYQTRIQDYIEDNAKSEARDESVRDDSDYSNYLSFVEENKLNQSGEYSFEVFKQENNDGKENEMQSHEGLIHVTFADNQYLNAAYYLDENHNNRINDKECYLMPGDQLFASDPEIKNANSNLYKFAGYRIWQYEDGKRSEYLSDSESEAVFVAPNINEGIEYSIEPVGVYQSRRLGNLEAYYYDGKGNKRPIFGGWSVNGKPVSDESALSATEDYTLTFDYDHNEYYFVESIPKNSNHSDVLGKVTFSTVNALEEQPTYSVGLHHYISVRIDYENKEGWLTSLYNWVVTRGPSETGIVSIKVNGTDIENNSVLPKLKCGDVLSIETNPEYKVYCTQADVSLPDSKSSTLLYNIKIPAIIGNEINIYTSKSEMIQYQEKKMENATVKLEFADPLNNYEIQPGDYIKSDRMVKVSLIPDSGYYISGYKVDDDGKYTEILSYEKFNRNINSIISKHPSKKYIVVDLSPGDAYGKCTYTIDKQPVAGKHNFKDGQKVVMTYTITDSDYQIDKLLGDKSTETKTISIEPSMDGSELIRDKYIKVKKK